MARPAKKQTSPAGVNRSAPAVPVEIVSAKELWSEILLKDGTILRLRPIVVEARRARYEFSESGEPVYHVKTAIITTAKSPKKLHKKRTRKTAKKT